MDLFSKHLKIAAILLITLGVSAVKAQINYSEKTRLNDNWEFLRGDLGSIWEAVRPWTKDSPETVPIWTKVTLPHCFNAEDAVAPDVNYYEGPGWYRAYLTINNPYPNGRILIHFEGAGQKSDVFVYQSHIQSEDIGSKNTHIGGYDEWTVDITDEVSAFLQSDDSKRFNGKVPLLVRCDNTRDTELIPSDLSDFNIYGGLYRYVNLVYVPAFSFTNIQTLASVDAKGKEGKLAIKTSFDNQANISDALINIKILSPEGKTIKTEEIKISQEQSAALSITIPKPLLWSPENPNLYKCELTLSSLSGDMTCEEYFGFRHFEFMENGPFMLNGKRLLLRGTHRHEDHAGVAAAMTEEMIIQEIQMMKDMGVNFLRLGHYQQSRIVLEQCDRLGILVWEEIPWCRGGLGGSDYQEQAKRMLRNMITQHINHPSVILWGLGNENDWPNDFPEFDKEKIRDFMSQLHNLSHQLDDSRKTCIRRCDFCKDIVDVYSPSIWAGWYQGIYTSYKERSYTDMQRVKHFLHVEWGGDSHARRYAEYSYESLNKISGDATADASIYSGIARASKEANDWSESYICDLIDWHLKEQETMPWLTGAAYWPFKDFSTPVRPENPVPYVNQKGVVERDFTPKEAYYIFQSYWIEEPMVRIFGHTLPTRWGKPDEKKLLKVYSNCDEVELFLNGTSLGKKKRNSQDFPAAGLRWESTLLQGKNLLKAVGKKGKELIVDEIRFEYETRPFGKEAQLKASIIENTSDYVWIEAELQDENGVVCLTSREYINFESIGDGNLVINQGTSTGSKKVQAYNGRARIKLLKNGGENRVAIKSDGLKTVFLTVKF